MSEDAGSRDEQQHSDGRLDYAVQRVEKIVLSVIGFALPVITAGGILQAGKFESHGLGVVTVGVSVIVGLFVGRYLWLALDPANSPEQANRQRVREAERSFENALRAGQATAPRLNSAQDADPDTSNVSPSAASAANGAIVRPQLGGLALPELWSLTHTRLDAYHEIALAQAKRSFRNAQVAMGLGFALLLAFVFVALNASTTAGAVVAGGLGAVSAALAGYVSRTFVVSQTASAAHLRAYFDQPLEFARYLAAERIIMDCGLDQAQRTEVLTSLVQAMVAPPAMVDPTSQLNNRGVSQ
ncbi:TRADD-N-associated membrane domain-containing protein [Streptomyces sp. NPDC002309]